MNSLATATSPYLRQHAHNPVHWLPWGPEAFALAREKNIPIFLSIGYSTCHWCHVMEKDSFERQEVADVLNANFVSIKVDREERPDVDSIYMSVVQAMTGRGGWPMSCFLAPDANPIWAATFLPRSQFIDVARQISKIWQSPEQPKILERSKELSAYLNNIFKNQKSVTVDVSAALDQFVKQSKSQFDADRGGFADAPKFPPAMALMTLMRIYRDKKDPLVLTMVEKTLKEMARGGIFDQLGGGFHRYSVDADWLVPHFEKMAYDNALLAMCYTEAFTLTKDSEYRETAELTLNYILECLRAPDGSFYTAEDADSDNAEGKFYVWTVDELKSHLSEAEYKKVFETYEISQKGNFAADPHAAALERAAGMQEVHAANILSVPIHAPLPDRKEPILKSALEKLKRIRAQRNRPLCDSKCVLFLNGLLIAAFSKAYAAFHTPQYLEAAQTAARTIVRHAIGTDGKICRYLFDGKPVGEGFLEDYAGIIFGIIELDQIDFSTSWLDVAKTLQDAQNKLFYNDSEKVFDDIVLDAKESLIARPRNMSDNAYPSGQSLSALNLIKLAHREANPDRLELAKAAFPTTLSAFQRYPHGFPMFAQALWLIEHPVKHLVISGPNKADIDAARLRVGEVFLPDVIVSTDFPEKSLAQLTYKVCEWGVCTMPLTSFDELLANLTMEQK